eukprot:s282_g39.t1
MNAVFEDLVKLVTEHGVSQVRGHECADQIMSQLGHSTVQRILTAPKPWADLKARASLCKPPLRIVLPEELQTLIKSKMDGTTPVGRKNNKAKSQRPGPVDVRVRADQIMVPHAVFKQQDGQELSQLTSNQINATSKGILIVNYDDALPYFAIQQAMTSEGLGLLVLDHHDERLPPNHTVVRVPALCRATSEPLIATAALFQLGKKVVQRNLPDECVAVHETPYSVIRVALCKDQTQVPWDLVASGPVKQMMAIMKDLPQQAVMDVWDRQYLDERLKRTEPGKSALVMVNIRIDTKYLDDALAYCGTAGCYVEQRTQDGRSPHPDTQVIWLPRRSFAEATVAQQSNLHPSKLARSGQRYGLRVARMHAEETHNAHRPDVVYLHGNDLMRFKVPDLSEVQCPDITLECQDAKYRAIMHQLEVSVDAALATCGKPQLLSRQKGRAATHEVLDVAIDFGKTYVWSTQGSGRRHLREQQVGTDFQIQHWARDLGGHMTYTRQHTNRTVVKRLENMPPLWNLLARSLAPYPQKLRSLRSKAWPLALHGSPSVMLADNHFTTLRTGAMRGLREHASGVNPMLHLSAVEHPMHDPQFHVLVSSVMTLRAHGPPEDVLDFIFSAHQLDSDSSKGGTDCSNQRLRMRSDKAEKVSGKSDV